MNTWRDRAKMILLFFAVGQIHDIVAAPWPNTREWMLAYHGSAALCDFALLACAANTLTGRLSFEMQVLCWFSIVLNFLGWIAYLAYAPPAPYDVLMQGLIYVQYFWLLLMGAINGNDNAWWSIFYQRNYVGPSLYNAEAQR